MGEFSRLSQDGAAAGMSVLDERRGVALEVERFLPAGGELFLRLHPDDVEADRTPSDLPRDLPHLLLAEVNAPLPYLLYALSSASSIRSSRYTTTFLRVDMRPSGSETNE